MFIIFLLFPLIAFILCLKNLDNKKNAAIFILFYGLFGYCQHFGLLTSDIARIGLKFEYSDLVFGMDIMESYNEGNLTDVYATATRYIIRPITSNPKIYIGILGLIFGFLCYNFYKFIYRDWTQAKRGIFFLLVLLALSKISLVTFTGVRNATASMLFLCSVYRYIFCDKKYWIIGVLLSPLIHFQMWSCIIIFAIYLLLPTYVSKWGKLFKVALTGAILISMIDLSGFIRLSISEQDGEELYNASIASKTMAYTTQKDVHIDDAAPSLYRQANKAFFTTFGYINRFGIFYVMWFMIGFIGKHKLPKSDRKMYLLLLIFSTIVISFYSISYHLGARISCIWWELFFVFFARIYSHDSRLPAKRLLLLIVFFNFASIASTIVNVPRLVEPTFWVCPAPMSIINGLDFSILKTI